MAVADVDLADRGRERRRARRLMNPAAGTAQRLEIVIETPEAGSTFSGPITVRGSVAGVIDPASTEIWIALPGAPSVRATVDSSARSDGEIGWLAEIDVSQVASGPYPIAVHALDLRGRTARPLHLGVVRLPRGDLDFPVRDSELEGSYLVVAGWCVFPGEHTSAVEVLIDGTVVAHARSHQPRPDIARGVDGAGAPFAGYAAVLHVDELPQSDQFEVSARAVGVEGHVWESHA
ncbi:MAG TPA: hypothetical protein VIJ41_02970, partial [Candidatus Nanopelagicales bacterium]